MKKIIPVILVLSLLMLSACTPTNPLVLENSHVSFRFEEGSFSLTGLKDLHSGTGHVSLIPGDNELWQLSFKAQDSLLTISNLLSDPGKASLKEDHNGNKTLTILWNNLKIPELKEITVKVTINLPENSGIADWHIDVSNHSDEWGLWEIVFPRISGFADTLNYDIYGSFGHRNGRSESWGSLYKNYKGKLDMRYPDGWGGMSMQFIGANTGENNVYMATHDPKAWKKRFIIDPGNEYYVKVYPENMGVPGSGFHDPFPFMLGVFQGNWLDAAKIYRTFALGAPWVSKGRVSEASTTPQAFKDVALWIREWEYPVSETTDYQKRIKEWKSALDFFGVPLGLHWYNWNIYPFDTHYPHFFPAKTGVKEFTRELTGMGVQVMPYINGRIVDKRIADIREFIPYAAKRNTLDSTYEEQYRNRVPQMVMCPSSKAYQDTIAKAIDKLTGDLGFNSVYIDQIAAAPSNLCFDKNHGHPLGGGYYWIEGYREMLKKVRKTAHSKGRNASITSECTAEPYMDGLDGYLMVNPRSDKSIPLLPAVYSGYTIYFASWLKGMDSDRIFISTIGRDVLWGCKPGWFSLNDLFDPAHKKKLDYFKSLGQAHYAARKFFVYGEFLDQTLSEKICTETKIPLQMSTLWRAEDGSLALAVANFSEKPAVFPVDINLSDYASSNIPFSQTLDMINTCESTIVIHEQKINTQVSLNPLEIKIIEISH